MQPVLWCAGGKFALPAERAATPAACLAWATENGIQPGWINEIHWLTGGSRSGPAPRWPSGVLAFTWADLPLLDHALLHTASFAIHSGERGLVLLGEEEEDEAHLLVLCSQKTATNHGLRPSAALPARFSLPAAGSQSLPASLIEGLQAAMLPTGANSLPMAYLMAACDEAGRMPAELPAGWRALESGASGCAVGLCNRLVGALAAGADELGLLVSLPVNGPGMVTVVESWGS